MKWDNDPFKEIKCDILDIIMIQLPMTCKKISLKKLCDTIDKFIEKLINKDES